MAIQSYISDVTLPNGDIHPVKAAAIPYGEVDSTSTSTAFTATVPGVMSLEEGTCVLLRNGQITSASGFTININSLGAKPVYNSMATGNDRTNPVTAPTRDTTIFNVAYTMLFVYSTTLVEGGCWICYRGYDAANSNTVNPATVAPLMDGTAAVGSSAKYAREDHVHPTDMSRLGGITLNTSAEPYDVPVSAYGVATITIGEGLGVSDIGNTATLKAKIKTINNASLLGSGNVAVQPTLVSGTNIKTINNESLLGSGNISIIIPSAIDSNTIHTKAVAGWGSVANITSGEGVQF